MTISYHIIIQLVHITSIHIISHHIISYYSIIIESDYMTIILFYKIIILYLYIYTLLCDLTWHVTWRVYYMPRSWTFLVLWVSGNQLALLIHSLRRAFYACSVVWCDMIFDAIRSFLVPWKPHSGLWVSLSTCARERPKHCKTWAVKMRTERGWKKCRHKHWQAVCWVWWEGFG